MLLSIKLLEADKVRKFFLMCFMILLSLQGAAAAQINVSVEVEDNSRHRDFGTAAYLEKFLGEKLVKKNFVNVVDTKFPAEIDAANFSAEEIGELLVFDAMELPATKSLPENFDAELYENLGVKYLIRCEVLALGAMRAEDNTINNILGATSGILSLIGSGSSSHDKTLRRVGIGFGLASLIPSERTALANVVNMQFISVETGQILWQRNFMGMAFKHHKPHKNYSDAWAQAYVESVEKSAELIARNVNKYVDKVLIKGKSDKNFKNQRFLSGGGGMKKLF